MASTRWSLAAVTLSSLMVLVGCGRPPAGEAPIAPSARKLKLALNWVPEPEFGGIYAARELGAFSRRGLDVETPGGGDAVLKMIATGQVEFGIVAADEIVIGRSQGIDVVGVFATYQVSPQGLMVRESRGMKEIGDLFRQPGTVAMQPGLAYKDFLERKFGFSKVEVVPYDGGVARFLADERYAQQCFVTSEPLAARRHGVEPKVFLVAESGYNPYTAVVATSGDFARKSPEVVASVVEALREGWRAYLDDPGPANAVMATLNSGMDAETFSAGAEAQKPLIETGETKRLGLGSMTLERWDTLVRQLAELGVVKEAPEPASCFLPPPVPISRP